MTMLAWNNTRQQRPSHHSQRYHQSKASNKRSKQQHGGSTRSNRSNQHYQHAGERAFHRVDIDGVETKVGDETECESAVDSYLGMSRRNEVERDAKGSEQNGGKALSPSTLSLSLSAERELRKELREKDLIIDSLREAHSRLLQRVSAMEEREITLESELDRQTRDETKREKAGEKGKDSGKRIKGKRKERDNEKECDDCHDKESDERACNSAFLFRTLVQEW